MTTPGGVSHWESPTVAVTRSVFATGSYDVVMEPVHVTPYEVPADNPTTTARRSERTFINHLERICPAGKRVLCTSLGG
jgi:hypothetical protein